MKKFAFLAADISFCLLMGCQQSEPLETAEPLVSDIEQIYTMEGEPEQSQEDEREHVFLNLDELGRYVDKRGTGGSSSYDEEDLMKLAEDETQRDYVAVVQRYMEEELQEKVSFLSTVEGTYNPRDVIVGMAGGELYLVRLRRWYKYSDIWTVLYYGKYVEPDPFADKGVVPRKNIVKYQVMEPSDIDTSLQTKIDEKMASEAPGYSYFYADDVLYAVLMAKEGESVELLGISGEDYYISIEYANSTLSYAEDYGEKPYILIRVDSPVIEIFFKEYSSMKFGDVRLNMP